MNARTTVCFSLYVDIQKGVRNGTTMAEFGEIDFCFGLFSPAMRKVFLSPSRSFDLTFFNCGNLPTDSSRFV